MDVLKRTYEQLENDLKEGTISLFEWNCGINELGRIYQIQADEKAQEAYEIELEGCK